MSIPVTGMASGLERMKVVPSHGSSRIRHILPMPVGACPVSRNPISGTVAIAYRPPGMALEVVSLADALAWATGRNEGAPRSVEELAAWLAREACASLGAPVAVRLDLIINPGPQRIVVEHAVLPRNP